MSLLTKEQQETIDRIRKERGADGRVFDEDEQLEEAKDFDRLCAIIDDLQSRAPKQYTEQELRRWLECSNLSHADYPWVRHEPTHKLFKPEQMKYKDPRDEAMWFSVYNFACISGALKAEP